MQYRVWWGEGSYHEIDELKQKIAQQQEENDLLKAQNEKLIMQINALRKNPKALESKARESVGLVKPDEMFYRVIPRESSQQQN